MRCECGCGMKVKKRFILGHNSRIRDFFGPNNPMFGKKHTEKARIKMKKTKSGIKHDKGYIRVHLPNHPCSDKIGYVFEHRLVIEKHLGRFLLSNEIPHHINGIRSDNRIENLKLFSGGESHMLEGGHIGRDPKTGKFISINLKKGLVVVQRINP